MCDEPINPGEAVNETYHVHEDCRNDMAQMFE